MKKILFFPAIALITISLYGIVSFANDFYTPSGAPATGAALSSAPIRSEFSSIEDGFDLLPGLTGNSELPVFVNSGETSLEAVSASTALTRLGGENTTNKDTTGGYVGMTLFKINFQNAADTFTSFFTNTNTDARTYTFQDASGTVEHTGHTIASHGDTSATGAELNTLTDDSMADTLHRHSELSASDGTPNQTFTSGADGSLTTGGDLTVGTGLTVTYADGGATIDEFSTDGTLAGDSDTAIPTEKAVKTYVDNNSGGDVGVVVAWLTSSVPSGYLECDGAAVSRTTYSALFAIIAETYGNGDGSTTFNLPDFRGNFLRGWDNGAGNDPDAASRTDRGDGTTGDNVGTKQSDELESHVHSLNSGSGSGTTPYSRIQDQNTTTQNTNATGGNETRPINVNVMWIIRY